MAIKIDFNVARMPDPPTLVLGRRDGSKLGMITASEINLKGCLNEADELQLKIYKNLDGKECPLWDEITDFKLIWCKEWNTWFDIAIELDETNPNNIVKDVSCVSLGESELSQLMLYEIQINTEDDISREDYDENYPTVLYRKDMPEASLLHRIMEKAPHYQIDHVDATIMNIQREFEFDNTSILDAFHDIAEEIGCIFIIECATDGNGDLKRSVSVYDLETYCNTCQYRGEYTGVCPECGSADLNYGYGNDTTIFIASDSLGNEINFTTDTDSVKNCFRLEAGDDLMTATIRNCNPNGSSYIWYISDSLRKDMSQELQDKLKSYDELYEYYRSDYSPFISSSKLSQYNSLVRKYKSYNEDLEEIATPLKGYDSIMNAVYNTIDLSLYLESALMPTYELQDTTAVKEASKLTAASLSPVAMETLDYISVTSASNAVKAMAKSIIDPRYKVEVGDKSVTDTTWSGTLVVTNLSAEEDTATTSTIYVEITDDLETYLKQQINNSLAKGDSTDVSISGLFDIDKPLSVFKTDIQKYSLNSLTEFYDACQACLNILIQQGTADKETWSKGDPNLYDNLYLKYFERLSAIEAEMQARENEIEISNNLQEELYQIRDNVQEALNFENYLGEDLWLDFCTYRRDDEYSNDNYKAEGLSNAETFEKANEFLEEASKELYRSAELQHSISTSLKNLLVLEEFEPIVDYFEVGNWIRIQVDGEIYKLRLLDYEIDYDDLTQINVTFSDVTKLKNGMSDMQSVIDSANSMASSYDYVKHQAGQGADANSILDGWVLRGLDATNTRIMNSADNQDIIFDEHGMIFRKYEPIIDDYSDEQLKIVNSTLAITDDGWESTRTAIGKFFYYDPANNNKLTSAYGVNAEVLVGELIIGESLGIYNSNGTLTFDKHGFIVSNGTNKITINPSDTSLFVIQKKVNGAYKNTFYIDDNGDVHMSGIISWDETNHPILEIDEVNGLETELDLIEYRHNQFKNQVEENYLGGVTTIGPDYVISPNIGGGYLYIASGSTSVTIDPAYNKDGTVFDVTSNGNSVMSVDRNGNAYFEGEITATSGKIGGFKIDASYIVSSNSKLQLYYDGAIISQNGSTSTEIIDGHILLQNSSNYIFIDGRSIQFGGSGSSSYITYDGIIHGKELLVTNGVQCGSFIANGTANITGKTTGHGNLEVIGTTTLRSTLTVDGNATVSGNLYARDNTFRVAGSYIYAAAVRADSVDYAANVRITNANHLVLAADGSSKRYKHDITENLSSQLDPNNLYRVNVVEFKYNNDYLSPKCVRYLKPIIGLIAEDVAEKYPIAADYNEDGTVETWNTRIIVPAMLKLIQDQHTTLLSHDGDITRMQSQLESLEYKLQQAFELIAEQKRTIESLMTQ